jgi:hypothetical protein
VVKHLPSKHKTLGSIPRTKKGSGREEERKEGREEKKRQARGREEGRKPGNIQ